MSKRIDTIKKIYKESVEEIYKETQEQEEIEKQLQNLDRILFRNIRGGLEILEDSEKIELIKLMKNEDVIIKIIETLKDDEEKIKYIPQITEKFDKERIIRTLKDENKIKWLEECENKYDVLVTVKDKEIVSQFLQNNEGIKQKLVKFLYSKMSYRVSENLWEFMKNAELQNEVIPHILADSKYEILDKMTDEMKYDIEQYLGKPIPQNIEEMSEYEKVGIDLDAIQEEVIVNEKQLNIDEMQRKFLSECKPDDNNKKRIFLKDFVGTISPTLKHGIEEKNIKTWENLLKSLKRMDYNIQGHSEKGLFSGNDGKIEPVRLQGIHGKYFVAFNGNHRMTLLKTRYLTEIKRANGDKKRIEEIDKEYAIEVSEAVDVPIDKEEMIGINMLADINEIQQNQNRISEFIENGEKTGYRIQNPDKEEIILKTKEELKQYLAEKIQQIQEDEVTKEEWEKISNIYKENAEYVEAFEIMSGYVKQEKEENEVIEEQIRSQEETIRDDIENYTSEEKQETTDKSPNMWISRFKQWDAITRNVPQQLKNKYTKMKLEIIQGIKEARKTVEQDKNNEGKNEEYLGK